MTLTIQSPLSSYLQTWLVVATVLSAPLRHRYAPCSFHHQCSWVKSRAQWKEARQSRELSKTKYEVTFAAVWVLLLVGGRIGLVQLLFSFLIQCLSPDICYMCYHLLYVRISSSGGINTDPQFHHFIDIYPFLIFVWNTFTFSIVIEFLQTDCISFFPVQQFLLFQSDWECWSARLLTDCKKWSSSCVQNYLATPNFKFLLFYKKYQQTISLQFKVYDTLSANVVKSFPKLAKSESGQIVSEKVKLT